MADVPLQSSYRDPGQPEARRFKAACAALPYERPKLEAVATFDANGDFGTMLDRAIAASDALFIDRSVQA
jgi:hypothetical protein